MLVILSSVPRLIAEHEQYSVETLRTDRIEALKMVTIRVSRYSITRFASNMVVRASSSTFSEAVITQQPSGLMVLTTPRIGAILAAISDQLNIRPAQYVRPGYKVHVSTQGHC